MRSRQRKALMPSFDSFLDIVTNVIGVMVLIVIVTVVNSGGMDISLGTPMLRPAPENARPACFECRGNRIVYIDVQELSEQFDACVLEHTGKTWDDLEYDDVDQVPNLFEENDVGTEFYRIKFEISKIDYGFFSRKSPTWIYQPRADDQGETISEINDPDSDYQRLLDSLDSKARFVNFTVRPDSFEVFRAARRLARAKGLATGWFPRPCEEPLAYGPGGRRPRVDD